MSPLPNQCLKLAAPRRRSAIASDCCVFRKAILSIFTVPVVLGGGKKLFVDGSAPHSFKLTRSRVSPNGLIVGQYEREDKIKIGDTALNSPTKAEAARQERMKREG